MEEGRSLTETPTWAVATVISLMVASVFFFTKSVELFGRWLDKRKRKSMLAALNKIKEELVVFGVLSLLMGQFSIFVAKICVKSSEFSTKYFPCIPETTSTQTLVAFRHLIESNSSQYAHLKHYCAEGYESFASYESLEQLHRLLFVLGVTHVAYSSMAIALAVIKIYSWRAWEDEAKSMATKSSQDYSKLKRMCSFVVENAYHPWSHHKVLVWLLCFSRQFWSSINKSDYSVLRLGFVTTHQLPLSYDFFNYMVRSMDEEFRDIVGISWPLWIYAILCIFLDFHGTNVYFWLSFLPATIIIIIGTKLHHIVVKLAVEIVDSLSFVGTKDFKLRDELFWFGKPRLLLTLIQFILFQNAFEMAVFLWSLWEIEGTSCFMNNTNYIVIRLTFGITSQIWCSFITFPLYVIITQMGSKYKRTVVSESVRISLRGWKKRVLAKQNSNNSSSTARLSSSSSMPLIHNFDRYGSSSNRSSTDVSTSSARRSWRTERYRRFSMMEYGDAGGLFTSQPPSNVDKGGINYDSDSSSDDHSHTYYEEYYSVRDNNVRYSRLL